ncbi:PP_RS20740 family protein [Tsukamurella ocularis]|uniref:PP_RS20740 family protein n=1 Tax=Tsukamurella ocularis TaxID=1970234 RepID=UPI002167BB2C|nr:hypothetical protein [Tsukamurella ocularis]MCS3780349.1 hypothetical protein [Tsukamurella ocularis]MCS3786096.1 hypothetical protein [Tsukamurella ocularis]MCS3849460.1 hypothetical protein [Tsukamurella ocularis]
MDDDIDRQSGFEESLTDLIGVGPKPFSRAIDRSFKPWHRPRKHYVRVRQWQSEIEYLVRDLKSKGRWSSELRYLTLPGSDLLDIRHLLATVCAQGSIRMRYLGFNSAADVSGEQATVIGSQFAMNRRDLVDEESEVVPNDFRLVGDVRSEPSRRVRRAGPFHVINLDLCGGFAGKQSETSGMPNYFAALQAVLDGQRNCDHEFLLLITSRMDQDSVDEPKLASLTTIVQEVFDSCEAYADSLVEAWALPGNREAVAESLSSVELFMLGISQWIVRAGLDAGLRASVRGVMTYRVGGGVGDDNIVSLAIRFRPQRYLRPDSSGLIYTGRAEVPIKDKECESSTGIPGRISGRTMVDDAIRADGSYQECVTGTADLLVDAGYSREDYVSWVSGLKGETAEAE